MEETLSEGFQPAFRPLGIFVPKNFEERIVQGALLFERRAVSTSVLSSLRYKVGPIVFLPKVLLAVGVPFSQDHALEVRTMHTIFVVLSEF